MIQKRASSWGAGRFSAFMQLCKGVNFLIAEVKKYRREREIVCFESKKLRAHARSIKCQSTSFACPLSSCDCFSIYSLITLSFIPTVDTK